MLLNLPLDIHFNHILLYLTFKDLGYLIKTCKFLQKTYDNNNIWKEIYIMTCPTKWSLKENSIHLDYNKELYNLIIDMKICYRTKSPFNIFNINNINNIRNCYYEKLGCKSKCNDITHYEYKTLEKPIKIINRQSYKDFFFNKARTRLIHKDRNILFLQQLVIPKRLEWYDIVNLPTY